MLFIALLLAAVAAAVLWRNVRDEAPVDDEAPAAPVPALAARGEYLARAGNCIGCHTARGGAPFAGGRAIDTPFGKVYSSNLTPDSDTGLGRWTPGHFWRALHNGRSRDGRLLYPAFPYPDYTEVTREDADAIYAYLRGIPPVRQAARMHELRFPYNTQAALAVWRALFFRAGTYRSEAAQSAEWNRGAYLVRGLGHCAACHAGRNWLGGTKGGSDAAPGGALLPMQHWYAPPLTSHVLDNADTVVQLLKTGRTPRRSVLGPMAEVVFNSTQYLRDADLRAMVVYLRSLPPPPEAPREAPEVDAALLQQGRGLYKDHCAGCHGEQGQGAAGGVYPALAGNRVVAMANAANVLQVIISGGFPPATAGNPRPYGMPPFGQALDDGEIAAVATYLRRSWGNDAAPVSALEVLRLR